MGGKCSRSKGEAKGIKIGLEAFWRGKEGREGKETSVPDSEISFQEMSPMN